MDIDSETQKKIQELQLLEQNLQSVLMQKQALELELSEIDNALTELSKSNKEAYKLVGQIMIKYDKKDIEKELKEKKDILSIKFKKIDSDFNSLSDTCESLRNEVLKKIQDKPKKS